jgi:L-ribulose-5-phosphate 3-epimerase UlaE
MSNLSRNLYSLTNQLAVYTTYLKETLTNFPAIHLVSVVLNHKAVKLNFNIFETFFINSFSNKKDVARLIHAEL